MFAVFIGYLIWKALKTKHTFPEYFTGGDHTHWIPTALSILSMNITFEYIFSSSANGFETGLAYGCYEWTAIPVIFFVAYYIMPQFLRMGIKTLPEYLEYRFNKTVRVLMAILFLFVTLALAVLSLTACGEFMEDLFNLSKHFTIIFIAIIGSIIMYVGGAATRIKANTFLFSFFLIAGVMLLCFTVYKVGGLDELDYESTTHLNAIMPNDSKVLPWKSVFLGGIWVLHLNYWAFYPPISHNSLSSRSLSNTQKGLMLVGTIKIVLAFVIIIPGVVGYEIYRDQITNVEHTLPFIISKVVPAGFEGIITMGYLATLFTTFSVIINTAMSLFTLDIYNSFKPNKGSSKNLIQTSKIFIIIFVTISILGAFSFDPQLPFFHYATLILELIAPITTSVFLIAIYTKRIPSVAAICAIAISLPIWIMLKLIFNMSNINIAGSLFVILISLMLSFKLFMPLPQPVIMVEKYQVKYERSLLIVIWGIFLVTIVASFYTILI